jgi:hypothetical protein
LTLAIVAVILLAHGPVVAQLTFVAPVDAQTAADNSSGWVASDEGRIAPESILESLAPGEVLVEPSIVHDLAARPRESLSSSIAPPQAYSTPPLSSRGGLSVPLLHAMPPSDRVTRFHKAPPADQPPHPAVVRVVAADFAGASLGSGTLVDVNDDHGLVVTNWHVVRDAPGNVIVVFPDGFQSLGRVLRMDANWDLAAILINKPRVAPVKLAAEAPQIGETLIIAGYGGGSYRAVAGACTQYLAPSVQHPQELVELAASARQGDSGGPIFNSRGELAGVLFGEGGGRTTGAYCGRVHSFLASAVQQLYSTDGSQLVQRRESAPISSSPSNVVSAVADGAVESKALDAHSHAAHDANNPTYWQHPHEEGTPTHAIENNTLANEESRAAKSPVQMVDTAEPASLDTAGATAANKTQTYSDSRGPVAAIELSDIRAGAATAKSLAANGAAAHPGATGIARPHADNPTTESKTNSLTWQFFAGATVIEQLKTILACMGVVAVLIHGTRLLSGSTASRAGASAKRVRK